MNERFDLLFNSICILNVLYGVLIDARLFTFVTRVLIRLYASHYLSVLSRTANALTAHTFTIDDVADFSSSQMSRSSIDDYR